MQECPERFKDFRMDYALGKMVLSDVREHIYDPKAQLGWFSKTMVPPPTTGAGYICYAPYFYLLMIPLSALSAGAALSLWVVSSMVLGLAGLTLLGRHAGRSPQQIVMMLVGAAASMPAWYTIALGQMSWFFVAFFCAFFLVLFARREFLAAVAIVLTAIKVQYAVIMVIPVLVQRRWKILISAAVLASVLSAAAASYVGWANVLSYPVIVVRTISSREVDYATVARSLVSIRGPLSILLPWSVSLAATAAVSFAGMVFLAWVWLRARKADQPSALWAAALTVVVGLFASAHSHLYDCLLLCIPAVLTLQTLDLQKVVRLEPFSLRIWHLVLLIYPMFSLSFCLYRQMLGKFEFLPFTLINVLLSVAGYKCFRRSLTARPAA